MPRAWTWAQVLAEGVVELDAATLNELEQRDEQDVRRER